MSGRLAEIEVEQEGEKVIVSIAGEIDGSNASEVRRAVAESVPAAARAVVLDLSATSYVDSAGVELIFELARRLTARRQVLALVVPEESGVRRVLELCDVGGVARIDPTRRQAEAGLGL